MKLSTEILAEELYKPVIKKFEKRKAYSLFIVNIWCADLADMKLISKVNNRVCFVLCVYGIFSKYTWVIPLKDKKGIRVTNAFQKSKMNLIANQTKYG